MDTVNISLTTDQVQLADRLTAAFDYANRSEFFRTLMRLVERKPEVLKLADDLILEPPGTRSAKKIITNMRATGKYSSQFLSSLKKGLDESDYFKD